MISLQSLLDEGAAAYAAGHSSNYNPYLHGTAAYWNWLEAWEQARKRDKEDECDWL